MRSLNRLRTTVLISSAVVGALAILETAAAETCERIEGWVLLFKATEGCTSPVPLCTQGMFLSPNPNWNGANWFFSMLGSAPSVGLTAEVVPSSTLSYAGKVRITTASGSIETSNTGVFDPVNAAFSQLDRITGGTGGLSGAKGFIWLTGTGADLVAGIRGEVRGNVCIPK